MQLREEENEEIDLYAKENVFHESMDSMSEESVVMGLALNEEAPTSSESSDDSPVLDSSDYFTSESNDQQVMEAIDENQIPIIARKCIMEQHERQIQEFTRDDDQKKKECHEAWMCLQDSIHQLENLRNELHFKSLQVDTLDQTVNQLRELQGKYEKEKQLWVSSIHELTIKIQVLKGDYLKLSEEAQKNAKSIPDVSEIISAMQSLSLQCEELKKKYIEECTERKRIYNEFLELKGNIRVFCRCRPLSAEEIESGASSVVEFDDSKENELSICVNGSTKKAFKFDHVFTPEDGQEDVFSDTAPVVVSVLDGYNVCIFAYGQTGTGKTFTMEGTPENRGVNFRTLEELFRVADERKEQYKYDISVSVLEVYNEQIRDLLASPTQQGQPVKKLEIKQVAEGVHHVPGLVEAQVHNMNEVWEVLQTGSGARAVGSTNANELSSRSHCILSVMVRGESLINGNRIGSKLWLVDLAGSERIAKTDVHGERLKEAQCINKSLSALGDVISALTTKSSHIPYRNSKLTHLLQDSLGGDSKTLMFVQISPNESDIGETLCSLNFASRVRGLELGPVRKQQDASELFKYKQMVERIRQDGKEAKKMEESLHNLETKFKGREQMCRHLQEKIKELESQLAKEKKVRLQCETKLKEQQRQSERLSEKPPLFRQLNSLRSVSGRSALSKDLTNLTDPLTENKQRSSLECDSKQQESKIKRGMTNSFPRGVILQKENIGEPAALARRTERSSVSTTARRSSMLSSARRVSVIPLPVTRNGAYESEATLHLPDRNARTARRTSISTMARRTSAIPLPRRTSMLVLPVRRNEVSELAFQFPAHQLASSPVEKDKDGNTHVEYHAPGIPTTSTPVSLRGLKNSHTLERFRRNIHSKINPNSPPLKWSNILQEINQKRETLMIDTDDNATVASSSSSSLDQKPPPNTSRLRRLSTNRPLGNLSSSGNVRAQRVLCGNKTSLNSTVQQREKE